VAFNLELKYGGPEVEDLASGVRPEGHIAAMLVSGVAARHYSLLVACRCAQLEKYARVDQSLKSEAWCVRPDVPRCRDISCNRLEEQFAMFL
jgi:hypothetical protein